VETKAPSVLIVEDHPLTREFLADNLAADGFEPLEAETAHDALRLLRRETPDIGLIDLGLPDRDGLDLLREIRIADRSTNRIDPHLPVILLTGRSSELERLRGFERGCDDYVVKPFSYHEVRVRLMAVLGRSRRSPQASLIRVGPLELNVLTREVTLTGRPIHLSKKEFALLRALAEEPRRVFTREELLRGVWGYQAHAETRTLDSHASRLRRKLGPAGRGFVVNVWGVGYRLLDIGTES
jgi:DNA-binding response OmpR family regulator